MSLVLASLDKLFERATSVARSQPSGSCGIAILLSHSHRVSSSFDGSSDVGVRLDFIANVSALESGSKYCDSRVQGALECRGEFFSVCVSSHRITAAPTRVSLLTFSQRDQRAHSGEIVAVHRKK